MVGAVRAVGPEPSTKITRIVSTGEAEDARQRRAQAVGDLRRGPDRRRRRGARRRPRTRGRATRGSDTARSRSPSASLRRSRARSRDVAAIDERLIAFDDALAQVGLELVVAGQ